MPGTCHRMRSRAKNYWKWENNDHVHLQTPLHPSAAKKSHTNKKQRSHDAGVTTTQYIYSTTVYTRQHAESAKQCQLLSPFPTDISSYEDKTFRANTRSWRFSLSLRRKWTTRNKLAPEQSERTAQQHRRRGKIKIRTCDADFRGN
jgi:hypothetical protein